MRRTNLQRQMHRRLVEEQLVQGHLPGQIVRGMVRNVGLTLRQARLDLAQVQDEFRRQDDELRQNRWKLADLAIASDRCDREFRAAVEAGDARRAMRVEKHRCKLLGIYHADRLRTGHMPLAERMEMESYFKSDLDQMYAQAPRNPDGSVVLTAFSLTPPPVDDPRYCRNIEQPIVRTSPKRRERIDTMRAMLAVGGRMDQLEAAARATYKLSARQVRADVRRLQEQLETAGYAMHQGMHDAQLLPLALRRRERIVELALKPTVGRIANPSEKPAAEPSESASGNSRSESPASPDASVAANVADSLRELEDSADGKANSKTQNESTGSAQTAPMAAAPAAGDEAASGNSQSELPTSSKAAKAKPKPPDVRLAAEVEIDRCRLLGLYPRQRPRPEEDQLLWTPPKWDLGRRDRPAGAGGAGEILRCAQNDGDVRSGSGEPNDSDAPGEILRFAQNDRGAQKDNFAPNDRPQSLPPASPWDEPGPYANLPHEDVGGRIDNPSYGEPGRRMDHLPYGRPLSDFDRPDSNLDRMVEEDFAVRDAREGIRHTAAELLRDPLGGPGRAGREPWKPPPEGA